MSSSLVLYFFVICNYFSSMHMRFLKHAWKLQINSEDPKSFLWVLEYIPQLLCSTMTVILHLQGECQLYTLRGRPINSFPEGITLKLRKLQLTLHQHLSRTPCLRVMALNRLPHILLICTLF